MRRKCLYIEHTFLYDTSIKESLDYVFRYNEVGGLMEFLCHWVMIIWKSIVRKSWKSLSFKLLEFAYFMICIRIELYLGVHSWSKWLKKLPERANKLHQSINCIDNWVAEFSKIRKQPFAVKPTFKAVLFKFFWLTAH